MSMATSSSAVFVARWDRSGNFSGQNYRGGHSIDESQSDTLFITYPKSWV